MELSSLTQQMLKQNPQGKSDALVGLIESGTIKPGTELTALVSRVEQLSNEQRQALAQQWLNSFVEEKPAELTTKLPQDAGAKLTKGNPSLPGNSNSTINNPLNTEAPSTAKNSSNTGNAAQKLAELSNTLIRQLINQPKLFAVQLRLLNTQQLVISDQPLKVGENVSVIIREDKQLQLLNNKLSPRGNPTIADGQASSQNINKTLLNSEKPAGAANTYQNPKSPLVEHAVGTHTADTRQTQLPNKQLQNEQLRQFMRQTLPFQRDVSTVLNQLQTLVTKAQTLPPLAKQSIVEPKTWAIIDKLVQAPKSPGELLNTNVLKTLLENSGAFADAKVKLNAKSPSTTVANTTGRSPQQLQDQNLQQRNTTHLIEDLKVLLTELGAQTAPQSLSTAQQKPSAPNTALLFDLLEQLQGAHLKNQVPRDTGDQLRQQIHRLAQSALFKITGLQLQQIAQASADPSVSSNSAVMEIPLRISDQVIPLTLHLQEKHYLIDDEEAPKDKNKQKRQKRSKRWQVFMEFELENEGKFASEINLVDDAVSTKLWAEKSDVRQRARSKLHELKEKLESAGVNISDLTLDPNGPPQQRDTNLDFSLIDIST